MGWEEETERIKSADEDEDFTNEDLRDLFAELGIDIEVPISQADIEGVATKLRDTFAQLEEWTAKSEEHGLVASLGRTVMVPGLIQRAQGLYEKLYSYAYKKWGAGAAQTVSRIVRPPQPDVQKIPTPEEFMGEYSNAFSMYMAELKQSKVLSKDEEAFAQNILRQDFFSQYIAKLGEFAKTGVSPFYLKEVSRKERGVSAETAAGQALEAALGPGVTSPTKISGTPEEVAEKMDALGSGIPREFVATARLQPLDFLRESLSPESIKIQYAGSQEGAGRSARTAPAGHAPSPRRA
jgi:hypothetical protein